MANYVSTHTGADIDAAVTWVLEDKEDALAAKADAIDVYNKSNIDHMLSEKADVSNVYTKSMVDSALLSKEDKHVVVELFDDFTCSDPASEIEEYVERGGRRVYARATYTRSGKTIIEYVPLNRIISYLRGTNRVRIAEFVMLAPIIDATASLTVTSMGVVVFHVHDDLTWEIVYNQELGGDNATEREL